MQTYERYPTLRYGKWLRVRELLTHGNAALEEIGVL